MVQSRRKMTKSEKTLERDLVRVGIFCAVLVAIFIIASLYFRSLSHFTYEGLKFTKERFDQDTVYHYYYYYTNTEGKVIQYNLYLRNDPRTNNVTMEGDPLILSKKYLYLTFDDSFPQSCRYASSSIVDLILFFRQNEFTTFNGVTNGSIAQLSNQTYISCASRPSSAEVFEFLAGNETKIVVEGNCHRVYVGPDCQIRSAVEQLKLQTILQARSANAP